MRPDASPSAPTLADRLLPYLEDHLFDRPGGAGAVNPWRDREDPLGVEGAAAQRRRNLAAYLGHFPAPGTAGSAPPVALVGEAPSWRGCRFTGIAFTAESLLLDPDFPLHGRRTSAFREKPLSEASATIVWGCLQEHFPRFLLWNALPLHPHEPGEPLSNRTPRRSEVAEYGEVLSGVLERVGAEAVVAVGRTAERSLDDLGIDATYVRHPSHGGARAFRAGVLGILGEVEEGRA